MFRITRAIPYTSALMRYIYIGGVARVIPLFIGPRVELKGLVFEFKHSICDRVCFGLGVLSRETFFPYSSVFMACMPQFLVESVFYRF